MMNFSFRGFSSSLGRVLACNGHCEEYLRGKRSMIWLEHKSSTQQNSLLPRVLSN